MKSVSTSDAFGMGGLVCPIFINPSATLRNLLSQYEETQATLQKFRDAGYLDLGMRV